MRGADYLRLAATSLLEKRGRAVGAVLGVAVAVVALSMALGIGESFQRAFVEQLQRTIAANSIIVISGAAGLTDVDIAYYRSIVGVRGAYGISITQGTVYTESGEQIVQLVAVDPVVLPEYLGVSDMDKALEEGEPEPRGLGVLVSQDLWRDPSTGRRKLEVGSTLTLRVRGKSVQLIAIGLLKQTGSSMMGQGFSTPTVFVDPEAYHSYIATSRNYAAAIVLVEDLSQLDRGGRRGEGPVPHRLQGDLGRRHCEPVRLDGRRAAALHSADLSGGHRRDQRSGSSTAQRSASCRGPRR
uniref:MacB-like periplasmic core domain-containing protein n=1 Tax=Thermofilum pendens TaxID=2269 RepID=A0A7C3WTT0_THEPE